jgi:hypothetical protein
LGDLYTTRQRLQDVLLFFRLYLRFRQVSRFQAYPLLVAAL